MKKIVNNKYAKKVLMTQEKFIVLFIVLLILVLGSCATVSNYDAKSNFQYGKIHLKSGKILTGSKLSLGENNVSMIINKKKQYFSYNDIKSIHSGSKKLFSITWGLLGTAITAVPGVLIVTGQAVDDQYNVLFAVGLPLAGGAIAGATAPLLKGVKWELIYEK